MAIGRRLGRVLGLIAAVAVVLFGSWTADLLLDVGRDIAGTWPPAQRAIDWAGPLPAKAWLGALCLAVLFGAIVGVYRLRGTILHSYATMVPARQSRKKVLILPLSTSNPKPGGPDDPFAALETLAPEAAPHERLRLVCQPGEQNVFSKLRWNWQQPLRAIRHHLGPLTHVLVIGSAPGQNGRPGSYAEIKQFIAVCRRLLPESVAVEEFSRGPGYEGEPFEDYNTLQGSFGEAIEQAARLAGGRERDVCLDVTGGFKMVSAAAVVVTLNRGATFGYVATDPPYEVKVYDAGIEGVGGMGS